MSEKKIDVYEEHGGVLQSDLGRARVTYFRYQIQVEDERVCIFPTKLEIKVTPEEKQIFEGMKEPMSESILFGKSKSAISELAYFESDSELKKKFLKELKAEITNQLKRLG